jgi:hypothetical protein
MLVGLLLFGCVAAAQDQSSDFSVVVLPDTQNYSEYNPAVFNAQTQWIVNNASTLNIQLVLHEGDIVNGGGDPTQWANADAAMKILDGKVPYVAVIGNHDYDKVNPDGRTAYAANFNKYFGPQRYAGTPYYQGSFDPNSNESFYSVFTLGGKQVMVLALEVYPRDAVLDWANSVIDANPDKEVIILTHSYMFADDTRVGRCDQGGKSDLKVATDNDGEDMWNKAVRKHANVSLVLSGHIVWNGGIGRRADLGDNGNLVNQILADFQNYTNGGNGYLRILTFHPSTNTIDVQTYSPWINKYLTDAANQFTINWHGNESMAGQPSLVEGRVRSTVDCKYVSGATVTADDASATTNVNGAFAFTTMATTPTITAVAPGWMTQSMSVSAPQGAGAQAEFFLAPAGKLGGTVKNSIGIPVTGATVQASGGVQPTSISMATDSNGQFVSDWIPTGSYTIFASTTADSATTTTTVTASQTTTVTLTLGATTPPGHTLLTGNVTSAIDGRALSGATVSVAGKSTTTDTSGHYAFNDLSPGTYTVNAAKSGWGSQSTSATISDGAVTTANIKLATSGRISGTVKKSDGGLAAGATVTISGGVIANTTTVKTNSSGAFTSAWVPVGNYTVNAADADGNTGTASTGVSAGQTASVTITLSGGGPPPPPPGSAVVTGRVISAIDGRALSGATVTLNGQSTTTSTTGAYSFSAVAQGVYAITAAKSGWGKQSITINVQSGSNIAPDIRLATSGRIGGTVKTSSGAAVSGATVTFTGGVISNTTSVMTSSTGSYVSGWIPVGDYTVKVTKNGMSKQGTAKVSAGQTSALNFTM